MLIAIWPNNDWCDYEDVELMSHMSDDYIVREWVFTDEQAPDYDTLIWQRGGQDERVFPASRNDGDHGLPHMGCDLLIDRLTKVQCG